MGARTHHAVMLIPGDGGVQGGGWRWDHDGNQDARPIDVRRAGANRGGQVIKQGLGNDAGPAQVTKYLN